MAPAPAKPPVIDSDDDDGLTCTICLDQWTSSGEHRLVSLKCGHLFGFACIERWIKVSQTIRTSVRLHAL